MQDNTAHLNSRILKKKKLRNSTQIFVRNLQSLVVWLLLSDILSQSSEWLKVIIIPHFLV